MSDQIVLTEITGYNLATNTVEILRFCDGLAYRTRPTETPANALYRPFLKDPGWSRVDIYSKPGQYGHNTPGEVVLYDDSGTLGTLLKGYAFDGRSIVQRIGDRGAAYPSGYVVTLNGTMAGSPAFGRTEITFHPADLTEALEKPLQSVRYAGTNALPAGVEGVEDIKGQVKPIVLALGSNMSPVQVNTSKQIYQASIAVGSQAVTISAVRDKGVPITAGAAYTNMADMIANAPGVGTYRVLSNTTDGCFFRLNLPPAGQITCDAVYGTASSQRTHGQVWQRLLTYAGVSGGSISSADITALDTAVPGEIECVYLDEVTAIDAIREVAESAGCAWFGDAAGVHRILQWTAPSGSPVATLTNLRTDTIEIADPVGNGEVAPAYLVTLEWGRNWTRQDDSALAGDKTVNTDTVRAPGGRAWVVARAWLASEYRKASSTDVSVKTPHPNAVEIKLRSMLVDQTQAQNFADMQLALFKVQRDMTKLSQWLSPALIDAIRVGSVVSVKDNHWDYGSGKLMRVAGVQVDRYTGKTELMLWG